MGSDPAFIIFLPKFKIFQSTLPGWGATGAGCRGEMAVRISIHAPRMGSDETMPGTNDITYISIHAPRMGSDAARERRASSTGNFNPRSPDGERPEGKQAPLKTLEISIHAPRMGSDCSSRCLRMTAPIFQSTLPGWGATWDSPSSFSGAKISIHAPRMGSDLKSFADCLKPFLFQSTLPGWGATAKMDIFAHDMGKIIHFQH